MFQNMTTGQKVLLGGGALYLLNQSGALRADMGGLQDMIDNLSHSVRQRPYLSALAVAVVAAPTVLRFADPAFAKSRELLLKAHSAVPAPIRSALSGVQFNGLHMGALQYNGLHMGGLQYNGVAYNGCSSCHPMSGLMV